MSENEQSEKKLLWPVIWLVIGLLGAVATLLTAAMSLFPAAGALGGITSAVAIVLTFVIAHRQADETSELTATVVKIDGAVEKLGEANDRLYRLTLDIAEQASAESYGIADEDATDEGVSDESNEPPYAAEALERLSAIGSTLTRDTAHWRQKVPEPAIRGNHGWFVESTAPAPAERWFVRKGRYWNMRKAMPREFLDALEEQCGVDPKKIKLDFQLKEHGLASWYARTYDDNLWRVSRSNRNPELGIQTQLVTDDMDSY